MPFILGEWDLLKDCKFTAALGGDLWDYSFGRPDFMETTWQFSFNRFWGSYMYVYICVYNHSLNNVVNHNSYKSVGYIKNR